jgi:hypothetical protein
MNGRLWVAVGFKLMAPRNLSVMKTKIGNILIKKTAVTTTALFFDFAWGFPGIFIL